jgi:hypothetical protein
MEQPTSLPALKIKLSIVASNRVRLEVQGLPPDLTVQAQLYPESQPATAAQIMTYQPESAVYQAEFDVPELAAGSGRVRICIDAPYSEMGGWTDASRPHG